MICGMLMSCSGDILGLMSGGSSADDVILTSLDWMMTCCGALPELAALSSASPAAKQEVTLQTELRESVTEKGYRLAVDLCKNDTLEPRKLYGGVLIQMLNYVLASDQKKCTL